MPTRGQVWARFGFSVARAFLGFLGPVGLRALQLAVILGLLIFVIAIALRH